MDKLMRAISVHYTGVYDMAQAILDRYKPCGVTVNSDGWTTCMHYTSVCSYADGDICCTGCRYLNKKTSCTVKCLGCKLGICPTITDDHRFNNVHEELNALRYKIAFYSVICNIRRSKQHVMNLLANRPRCKYDRYRFCFHANIPGLTPNGYIPDWRYFNPNAKWACDVEGDGFKEKCIADHKRQTDRFAITPKAVEIYNERGA